MPSALIMHPTADRVPNDRQVTIHAAWSPGEVRVAAIADRALIDYALWRPGTPDGVGDVYRARVTRHGSRNGRRFRYPAGG